MKEASYFKVLYDGQCEICQACVSWLQVLDRRGSTQSIPIDADALRQLDPRLELNACLRELHVLGPDGQLYFGWDAVRALLASFPLHGSSGLPAVFRRSNNWAGWVTGSSRAIATL